MSSVGIDIEVFTSMICSNCQRASRLVDQLLKEPGFENITWCEVNVVEEIDHAVALGVLTTPTIFIGGALAFTALPSRKQLRSAVQLYLAKQEIKQ